MTEEQKNNKTSENNQSRINVYIDWAQRNGQEILTSPYANIFQVCLI